MDVATVDFPRHRAPVLFAVRATVSAGESGMATAMDPMRIRRCALPHVHGMCGVKVTYAAGAGISWPARTDAAAAASWVHQNIALS